MPREHGVLFRRQSVQDVSFTRHTVSVTSSPSAFEFHDLKTPLEPDEPLVLEADRGEAFRCRALDQTEMWAVVETT
jgi:hypothetical protein